jgi:hypothetical protein
MTDVGGSLGKGAVQMNIRPVFLVLSFAFGVAVIGAAITTKNYVDTRHAEGRQAITRPAG